MDQSTLYLLLSLPIGLLVNYLFQKIDGSRANFVMPGQMSWIRWPHRAFMYLNSLIFGNEQRIVYVITDGIFIDSALFFLSVFNAASNIKRCTIIPIQTDWANIGVEICRRKNCIAYLNRRSLPPGEAGLSVWSNICFFRGYGLFGRPELFRTSDFSLKNINAILEEAAKERRLKVITMGSDSVDVLRTPLTPIFDTNKVSIEILPADQGLKRFLSGYGDLYIGGLPQRLECLKTDMVEILNADNNPLMFGIDVMAHKGAFVDDNLMFEISFSWSRLCRKLSQDRAFCQEIYHRWTKLSHHLQVDRVSFSLDDFLTVVHSRIDVFLKLFAGRDDAAAELIRSIKFCLNHESDLTESTELTFNDILISIFRCYEN